MHTQAYLFFLFKTSNDKQKKSNVVPQRYIILNNWVVFLPLMSYNMPISISNACFTATGAVEKASKGVPP